MDANPLLESYLKTLRLPCFLHNYRKFAEDAAQANLGYDRFLLSLAEQEMAQRETNRQTRLIQRIISGTMSSQARKGVKKDRNTRAGP